MALAINRTHPIGAVATYARILSVNVDFANRAATIDVGDYLSEEARQAGCAPLERRTFLFSGDNPEAGPVFPFTDKGGTRTEAYAALKELPEFEGAADA